jgi:hypothetical protein
MRTVTFAFLVLAAGLLDACNGRPVADPEGRATHLLRLDTPWLEGKAVFHRSLEAPTFGITLRVRGRNFGALENALGTNNPCFSVAFVERCDNGVSGPCAPSSGLGIRGRVKTLDVPIWCPSVGTAFAWQGEFTDYRRVIGHPGMQYHPLMRCGGNAVGAVFLFPSPLHVDPGTLPQPGIPLGGLRVSEWVSL